MANVKEQIYENAGRRYCKNNNFDFIGCDSKGVEYYDESHNKQTHTWDHNDAKIINFGFFGAREF